MEVITGTKPRAKARNLRDEAAKLREVRRMEAGARERDAEAAKLEGEAEDLWNAARLVALTVYLGQVGEDHREGAEDL